MVKKEIIDELLKDLYLQDPYLDIYQGDGLYRALEFAYRRGYESAIKNYCMPEGDEK